MLTKVELLVLEDFGIETLGPDTAEQILEIVVRGHERGSIVITTNRPTEDWGQFHGDVPAATTVLDRFAFGRSVRVRARRAKDG
jgi:DNA replication protein DnaC